MDVKFEALEQIIVLQTQLIDASSSDDEENNENFIMIDSVPLRRFEQVQPSSEPVFIDHENRQFLNPISYIGGPRIDIENNRIVSSNGSQIRQHPNRRSAESITSYISID